MPALSGVKRYREEGLAHGEHAVNEAQVSEHQTQRQRRTAEHSFCTAMSLENWAAQHLAVEGAPLRPLQPTGGQSPQPVVRSGTPSSSDAFDKTCRTISTCKRASYRMSATAVYSCHFAVT